MKTLSLLAMAALLAPAAGFAKEYTKPCTFDDHQKILDVLTSRNTVISKDQKKAAGRVAMVLMEESMATTCVTVLNTDLLMGIPEQSRSFYRVSDQSIGTFDIGIAEDIINRIVSASVKQSK